MTRVKLDEEQLRELLEAYQTEETPASIAARFGINVEAVVTHAKKAKVRRPTGLKPPRSKWHLTDEQKRDMLAAYAKDDPIEDVGDIARRFNVPANTVVMHAVEAGVRRPTRPASS